jgi:hypothetical protein
MALLATTNWVNPVSKELLPWFSRTLYRMEDKNFAERERAMKCVHQQKLA